MVKIANPQFAFLEEDYSNPNLIQETPHSETKKPEIKQAETALVISWFITMYIKLAKSVNIFIWIPIDLYCASILIVAEKTL